MPSLTPRPSLTTYWRSLDELDDSPAFRQFVEQEFPNYAPELLSGPTRRQFLKVMGASLALAGMTGCRWPRETIVPATRQPGIRTPGVTVNYATAIELNGVATGLLVTSYDGRPIKIEGNELHPFSRGKTDAYMQASVLELYDPDRSIAPRRREAQSAATWAEFETFTRQPFGLLRSGGGRGLYVLTEPRSGPTFAAMKERFGKTFPNCRWFEYTALSRDNERQGAKLAFGRPLRTHYAFDRADVILTLDSDFLMTHPAAVRYAGDFAQRRRADDFEMSRVFAIESRHSLTGSNADERIPLRAAQIGAAAQQIHDAVTAAAGEHGAGPLNAELVARIGGELKAHRGRGIVIVGENQPAEVHALGHGLNAALENIGATVSYTEDPDAERPAHLESIRWLVDDLNSGRVEMLLILGGNPVYDAPSDLKFKDALARAQTSIHLSLYRDESSRACSWHIPAAHFLESWDDARAFDGTISIVQPLIEPLYSGRSAIEILALLSGDERTTGYELVRRTFAGLGEDEWESRWRRALRDGIVEGTAWATLMPTPGGKLTPIPPPEKSEEFELVFAQDYRVYDGRFANNGWLQELPDAMSKLAWDNAALISVADADRLRVERGDFLNIETGGAALEVPAFVLPGQAPGSITLTLGGGRGEAAGVCANGAGFDAYRIRSSAHPHIVPDAKVTRGAGSYRLVGTQDHHAIDSAVGRRETQGRLPELYREQSLAEYRKHPEFAKHTVHLPIQQGANQLQSPWPAWDFDKLSEYKWGMAIDLSACTGCSACVIACQAENNVPVVGKEEVGLGREMQWIRIDRYFRGRRDDADPQVAHQPVPCMHCENAPCEQVCPVAATTHDREGLNVMVYNRCVGTRYCLNNCPYKVRRFNWFYNHHGPRHPRSLALATTPPVVGAVVPQTTLTDIEKLVMNPEVTVRSRGVMEKCTYCVQRISAGKSAARNEKRPIRDGEITPACAQACPTSAIIFGNLKDPDSRVRKAHDHPRGYAMLAEINTRPRTQYLAKIRNPLDQPAGADDEPGGHEDHHANATVHSG